MRSFFEGLTPEQRKAALEYDGSEVDNDRALNMVARLRKMGNDEREFFRFGIRGWLLEAADEIERLRALVITNGDRNNG